MNYAHDTRRSLCERSSPCEVPCSRWRGAEGVPRKQPRMHQSLGRLMRWAAVRRHRAPDVAGCLETWGGRCGGDAASRLAPQDLTFAEQAASGGDALWDLSGRPDWPSPSGGYRRGGRRNDFMSVE